MSGPSRRSVLRGGAAALAAGWALAACGTPPEDAAPAPVAHQPGVLTPPPPTAVHAAYDLTGTGRDAAATVLRELSGRIAAHPELEVTVAIGRSVFDSRFGLAAQAPRRLVTMPGFPNDVLDPAQCHGDLLLQVCGPSSPRPALAAIVPPGLRPRWSIDGFRQDNTATAGGRSVDRNLFGFRDGAGNPAVTDTATIDEVVWVGTDQGEPAWAVGGSYQVVRIIRLATQLWDTESVARQETVFGRRKVDGAALTGAPEDATLDFGTDPDGGTTALDSHIRRANPRTPGSEANRILRRGYSFRRGSDTAGNPDEGMVFVCFQRDLDAGFATIQQRLAGQALDRYILTVGGGYFFVPPAGPHYIGAGLL